MKIHADLYQKLEDGGTKYEHLERIEKQTGKSQLPEFEIPFAGIHLWEWFWQLSNRRPAGFGLSLLPFTEFKSWMEVMKLTVHDWEIDILLKMDAAFVSEVNSSKKENNSSTGKGK